MADEPIEIEVEGAVILSFDQWRERNPNGVVAPEYNAPMYLRNRMINVDQITPELTGYKHIKSVIPAADLHPNSAPLQISWGAYDYVNAEPDMGPSLEYTADGLNYKLDHMADGRFLDLRIRYEDDVYDAKISAMDMDFTLTGKR